MHIIIGFVCVFITRIISKIYEQIWRYAGSKEHIRLLISDAIACIVFVVARTFCPHRITFIRAVSLITMDLLWCIAMRLIYQLIYQKRTSTNWAERVALNVLRGLTGTTFSDEKPGRNRIKVAIIGAGSVGAMLADELIQKPKATYEPVCFVDIDKEKTRREIYGVPVLAEASHDLLNEYQVQEVVFALPNVAMERRKELYGFYKGLGLKIKAYDYPTLDSDALSGHAFSQLGACVLSGHYVVTDKMAANDVWTGLPKALFSTLIYNSPKTGYNEKANRPKEANVSKEPAETHPVLHGT